MPTTLATSLDRAIDALYKQKAKIAEMKRKLEEKLATEKEKFDEMEEQVYSLLRGAKTTMGAGKVAKVEILERTVPVVEDWEALYKYIGRTKSFDLLNKDLSSKAVVERWEDGKKVPGVGEFNKQKLSLTKNAATKKVVSR